MSAIRPTDDELATALAHENGNGTHDDTARLGHVAMMIAPTAEIMGALVAGESVPVELLDPAMVARFGRRPGIPIGERLLLTDLNTLATPLTNGDTPQPFALLLDAFLAMELPRSPPILGTADETLIPTGGLSILAGMPAVGKTTLILDMAFHLAAGQEWLGFPVERPMNILLVENEGPQHKFQQKLAAKHHAWGEPLEGDIHIQTWRWGAFDFNDPDAVERIIAYLSWYEIDLVIGDPLDTLGPRGVGSPEDTRAFVKTLVPIGLTSTVSFLFLHHMRKELSASEINEVSGAWGGRLDSLMVLKDTAAKDELRLSFPKTRWIEEQPEPMILGKIRERKTFELLAREEPEAFDDDTREALLRKIIDTLRRRGGHLERPALALAVETDPKNRTFQRALRLGLDRNLLASEKKGGRKVDYSLTEASW